MIEILLDNIVLISLILTAIFAVISHFLFRRPTWGIKKKKKKKNKNGGGTTSIGPSAENDEI